jgi:hypothetical protein
VIPHNSCLIHEVNSYFEITKELASVHIMHGTIEGKDIF